MYRVHIIMIWIHIPCITSHCNYQHSSVQPYNTAYHTSTLVHTNIYTIAYISLFLMSYAYLVTKLTFYCFSLWLWLTFLILGRLGTVHDHLNPRLQAAVRPSYACKCQLAPKQILSKGDVFVTIQMPLLRQTQTVTDLKEDWSAAKEIRICCLYQKKTNTDFQNSAKNEKERRFVC